MGVRADVAVALSIGRSNASSSLHTETSGLPTTVKPFHRLGKRSGVLDNNEPCAAEVTVVKERERSLFRTTRSRKNL